MAAYLLTRGGGGGGQNLAKSAYVIIEQSLRLLSWHTPTQPNFKLVAPNIIRRVWNFDPPGNKLDFPSVCVCGWLDLRTIWPYCGPLHFPHEQ